MELREQLIAKGHRFRSNSDTEVLLAAYAEWGEDCLQRFNGMWAFLIADTSKKVLFGARDRFGVKPLYRGTNNGIHYFASEIKALRKVVSNPNALNTSLVARFLAEGRLDTIDAGTETFFSSIIEIPAAHAFSVAFDGTERIWRYWDLPVTEPMADSEPVEDFAALFEDAVRLRMRSDVPVGASLSGGLDSSSIVSVMSSASRNAHPGAEHGLHAFSYMPAEFDEKVFVRETVQHSGATLHRIEKSPLDFWNSLPKVLEAQDEPLHSPNALVGFEIYRVAREAGVKVLLNGQGADEVLGGYHGYFSDMWLDLMQRGQGSGLASALKKFSRLHGESYSRLALGVLLRTVAQTISWRSRLGVPSRPHSRLLNRGLEIDAGSAGPSPVGLRNVLKHAVQVQPLPLFLRNEDRNSMAHGVEVRLPFMDYRLVELAFSLPDRWKLNGGWNKYILREAMKGKIPENVRTRPDKMGFPVPFSDWIRGPLRQGVREVLLDHDSGSSGWLDRRRIGVLLGEHDGGRFDHGLSLFHAAQFARWIQVVRSTG